MLYIRSQFRNIFDELVFNGKGYYPNGSNGTFSVNTNMITYSKVTTDKTVGGYIIFNSYTTPYFYMTFWDVNNKQISTQKCDIVNGSYTIKTAPLNADWVSFSFFADQTNIDLYKMGETYPLDAAIKHEQELNGDERIDLTIEYTENNRQFLDYYEDVNMWLIEYDNKEYVIINEERYGYGDYQKVECVAMLSQLFRLNTDRIYKRYDASLTTKEAYDIVFANTPFTYVVVDAAPSSRFEGLGDGESRLEVFKKLIDRYGHEFKIVGNVFYLYAKIGNDTNFEFRYKINASNIKKSINAENMYTYIRGYADFPDDTGEENTAIEDKAKIRKEYTHPVAKFLGKLHAPRWSDGRVKYEDVVVKSIQKIVDDSLEISFTANIADMSEQGYDYQNAQVGDRVFLVDERIMLDTEIRVVKIAKELDAEERLLKLDITFGTGDVADQYESKLTTAVKDITDIMEGNKALPFFALGEIARSMINKINNTSSELVFDTNGIHAIDKNNPNNIVTYNSSGWYLSTDGGMTTKNAMTAEGIVANSITTGSLLTENVTIIGRNANMYMNGDQFVSYDPNSLSRTVMKPTGLNITRPDGGVYMVDGVPKLDLDVQRSPLRYHTVDFDGRVNLTTRDILQYFEYFYTSRKARYLIVSYAASWDAGNSTESGEVELLIQEFGNPNGNNNETSVKIPVAKSAGETHGTVQIDLGVPTYEPIQFYLMFRRVGGSSTDKACIRSTRVHMRG
ncbi:tail protein (putative endopeptidase) [Staphylococcus simulans]|uniref:prophage endopeptidase tail family protein n=1 Tax=Staphylococcus simulans TaxID=1286 RepID=UPI0030BFEBB3